jgi:hypothetical protein
MSVAREVTIDYDLQLLAEAAREAGFIVTRNASARDYWGGTMKGASNCEIVISSRTHKFDMGFVRGADGKVKMLADAHGGYVQNDLANKILPRYAEKLLERDRRFKVTNRQETAQQIVLTVGRR